MFISIKECPKCKATGQFYSKDGYSKTKHNHQPIPRYKCKECGRRFTSHTQRTNKFHKKPAVNAMVFKWVCSGVTLNQIGKNLDIDKKTVMRKIQWLADQSIKAHSYWLNSTESKGDNFQIDEMETFEATRLKPLSIAMAVNSRTKHIVSLRVASMAAKGHIAAESREKYGVRQDTRKEAMLEVLAEIKKVSLPNVKISSDAKTSYVTLVKSVIPDAKTVQFQSKRDKRLPKSLDPLFAINHLCAKLRADVAPLARKSWTTTKTAKGLQNLLWIYIAWNNGYDITKNTNDKFTFKKKSKNRLKTPRLSPT